MYGTAQTVSITASRVLMIYLAFVCFLSEARNAHAAVTPAAAETQMNG